MHQADEPAKDRLCPQGSGPGQHEKPLSAGNTTAKRHIRSDPPGFVELFSLSTIQIVLLRFLETGVVQLCKQQPGMCRGVHLRAPPGAPPVLRHPDACQDYDAICSGPGSAKELASLAGWLPAGEPCDPAVVISCFLLSSFSDRYTCRGQSVFTSLPTELSPGPNPPRL